jgi:undecaprenyl-diphosphatase
MTLLHAIILGLLQGITEFLPVSSSGHLVLLEHVLNIHIEPSAMQGFDIILHAGTACAIFLVYIRTWFQLAKAVFVPTSAYRPLLWLLCFATIPAGVIGVLFGDLIADYLRTLSFLSFSFSLTALLLISGWYFGRADRTTVTKKDAIIMGVMQACAIVPGLSRSGSTIAAGMMSGLKQKSAIDFSFQMAFPVIAGAFLLTMADVLAGSITIPAFSICITGFMVSLGSSLLAMYTIRALAHRVSFAWFAAYLFPLAYYTLQLAQK